MRELHLIHGVKTPRGLSTVVKFDAAKSNTYERQADGSYIVRLAEDPEHEWLVPAAGVRGERRERASQAQGTKK